MIFPFSSHRNTMCLFGPNLRLGPEHELFHIQLYVITSRPILNWKTQERKSKMKTATITDFRQKMKEHLDQIQKDQDIHQVDTQLRLSPWIYS